MTPLRGKYAVVRLGLLALACAGAAQTAAPTAWAASSQPYADAVLADRPISYLRLDDTVTTGYPGEAAGPTAPRSWFYGGPGLTPAVQGAMGDSTAMRFSPGGGTIDWRIPSLTTTANGQYTVEAWIRLSDYVSGSRTFLSFGTSSVPTLKLGHFTGLLAIDSPLGGIPSYGRFERTSYNLSGGGNGQWFGGFIPYARNWVHIAVTRDYDGVFREYINGVQTQREASYQQRVANGATIGTDATASISARFDGDVDEVAYYPAALTQSQIQAHHQAAIDVGLNQPAAPVASAPPTVQSNTPDFEVGQRLMADEGSWNTADVTYRYRWNRCDATGGSCVPILGDGASTKYYRPGFTDAGTTMSVTVTATNWAGTATVDSAASPILTEPPAPNYRAAVLADSPSTFNQLEDIDYGFTWPSGIGNSNYRTGLDATGGAARLSGHQSVIAGPGALADGLGLNLQNGWQAAYGSATPRLISTDGDWALELWVRPGALSGYIADVGPAWRLSLSTMYQTQNSCPGRGSLLWSTNAGTAYFGAGSCIDVGVWSHVVLSRDATTTRLFVNGVEAALSSALRPTVLPSLQLQFGGAAGGVIADKYRGGIDEVAVFARALTGTEVAEHYAAAVVDGIN